MALRVRLRKSFRWELTSDPIRVNHLPTYLSYRMKPGKGNDGAAGEADFPGQGRIEIIAFRPRFSSERMQYT